MDKKATLVSGTIGQDSHVIGIKMLSRYLAVGRHDFQEDERKFKSMGFDRVYPPEIDMAAVAADLENDLQAKRR